MSDGPRQRARVRQVTAAERELFRDALTGVRPLISDTVPIRAPRPSPHVRHAQRSRGGEDSDTLRDPSASELVHAEELSFKRVGVRPTVLHKLKRGQVPSQGTLDLHGLTSAEAKSLLLEFLDQCRARGLRCVRIVHGKGYRSPNQQAVLKPKIAHWLSQRDEVVAYVSAQAADGGTGALYVLLKLAG